MGTIVEVLSDDKGMIWPKEISPYQVHLVELNAKKEAEKLYKVLKDEEIDALWDDRDESAGVKFADADLMGIPIRVVISERAEKSGGYEYKLRNKEKSEIIKEKDLIKKIKEYFKCCRLR